MRPSKLEQGSPVRLIVFYQNIMLERMTLPDNILKTVRTHLQPKLSSTIDPKMLFLLEVESRQCLQFGDAEDIANWAERRSGRTIYCYLVPSKQHVSHFVHGTNRTYMNFAPMTTTTSVADAGDIGHP